MPKKSKPQPPLTKRIYRAVDGEGMDDLERLAQSETQNARLRLDHTNWDAGLYDGIIPTAPDIPFYLRDEANTTLYNELRKFLKTQSPRRITRRYQRLTERGTGSMRLLPPEDLRFLRDLARLGFYWVFLSLRPSTQKEGI